MQECEWYSPRVSGMFCNIEKRGVLVTIYKLIGKNTIMSEQFQNQIEKS
jgi:hypothetical protein